MSAISSPDPMTVAQLRLLVDLLLPGSADGWPAASKALGKDLDLDDFLDIAERDWVGALALGLSGQEPVQRVGWLSDQQRREPERFTRLLRALYAAYYSTAMAQERILSLSLAGPREASPHVDQTLVEQVVARQAGARRL